MSAIDLSCVQGLLYPSSYDVLRHWTVPDERSRTGATVLTGIKLQCRLDCIRIFTALRILTKTLSKTAIYSSFGVAIATRRHQIIWCHPVAMAACCC